MSGFWFITQKDTQEILFEDKRFHSKADALGEMEKYFQSIGYLKEDINYFAEKLFNIEYVKQKHYTEYLN
jgi:hypothetical protein|tara:strand:+ start:506 stop:715 length:210 start_codon:yes stop_codon:yes gene_type:complete